MQAELVRHALDRVPLSLIIDDATLLLNLNYFFMRDRSEVDGIARRWEDVPVVHPECFTRAFAEWCLEQGVRGKFSVVPCPAGLGRIDRGLPLLSSKQQESWLNMAREIITPALDITPELLTHTYVLDLDTWQPVSSRIWEQYEWEALPVCQEELVRRYIATACRILDNVGLRPGGVTSPGGLGGRTMAFYARVAGEAVREVTGNPTPYLFKRVASTGPVDTFVWQQDKQSGTAVGEVVAATEDRTGSWTGYGQVDADYYITEDLEGGRLPEVIRAGDPAILCSHWQGLYGLHSEDQRGFRTLKVVVKRLAESDPAGERTRWRKCSEIATYACAREMAAMSVETDTITLDLPVLCPELTLRLRDCGQVRGVWVNRAPLACVSSKAAFESGTYLREPDGILLAMDPVEHHVRIELQH